MRRNPVAPRAIALVLLFCLCISQAPAGSAQVDPERELSEVLLLLLGTDDAKDDALVYLEQHWQTQYVPMLLEVLTFSRDPAFATRLIQLLENGTGKSFGYSIERWQQWLWNREPQLHPLYSEFKSALYGLLDERFEGYFGLNRSTHIRLDEVQWGGVLQDGIPPLRNPTMIAASAANYLHDDDIVFGLAVNGDVRAYPRRILGWHEMFVDEVGAVPVVGVYCTLCGTMILYKTEIDGVNYELGTSGFLYRSNKLMYDRATQSLWNTLWGKPVIGPLADRDITLERMSVVTTTWGEWRRRHPQTKVLSLATGYTRDYAEGAAYADYFATDTLMFQVPVVDSRMPNKAEILGLVFPQHPQQPLAIAADYLARHTVYEDKVGDLRFVVLTDPSGANRVYEAGDIQFTEWDGKHTVRDARGRRWQLEEAQLTASDGRILHRLPAHRSFWFGWYSAYNHTRLVH